MNIALKIIQIEDRSPQTSISRIVENDFEQTSLTSFLNQITQAFNA